MLKAASCNNLNKVVLFNDPSQSGRAEKGRLLHCFHLRKQTDNRVVSFVNLAESQLKCWDFA